jgi:hypothetical protein
MVRANRCAPSSAETKNAVQGNDDSSFQASNLGIRMWRSPYADVPGSRKASKAV